MHNTAACLEKGLLSAVARQRGAQKSARQNADAGVAAREGEQL